MLRCLIVLLLISIARLIVASILYISVRIGVLLLEMSPTALECTSSTSERATVSSTPSAASTSSIIELVRILWL